MSNDNSIDGIINLRNVAQTKGLNDLEVRAMDEVYRIGMSTFVVKYPYIGDVLTHERFEDYFDAQRMYAASCARKYVSDIIDSWHKEDVKDE